MRKEQDARDEARILLESGAAAAPPAGPTATTMGPQEPSGNSFAAAVPGPMAPREGAPANTGMNFAAVVAGQPRNEDVDKERRRKQQEEHQQALAAQMVEVKRRKDEEARKLKEEDDRFNERLRLEAEREEQRQKLATQASADLQAQLRNQCENDWKQSTRQRESGEGAPTPHASTTRQRFRESRSGRRGRPKKELDGAQDGGGTLAVGESFAPRPQPSTRSKSRGRDNIDSMNSPELRAAAAEKIARQDPSGVHQERTGKHSLVFGRYGSPPQSP